MTDYYTSTSGLIGETTAGGVAGYVQDTALRQGDEGSDVLQESKSYYQRSAGGVTVYPFATDTLYGDGTDVRQTSYQYQWFAGTVVLRDPDQFGHAAPERK